MGSPERRDRALLYAEILERVQRAHAWGERPVPTRIQHEVNVPTARFKEYVEDLQRRGLLEAGPEWRVTPQGLTYVEEYRKVRAFLRQFGLLPRGNGRA